MGMLKVKLQKALHTAVQHATLFNIYYVVATSGKQNDLLFSLKNMFFVWFSQHVLSYFICFPAV